MDFLHEPGRIYAMDGDKLTAEVTFPARDGTAVITHTFVDDSLRGQGVAGALLEAAVAEIRGQGLRAEPVCSYAKVWFDHHPEAADLL